MGGARPDLGRASEPDPDSVREAGEATDGHDSSMTYSAWSEDRDYGDDLYRFAAAGRLGLIDLHWPTSWYLVGQPAAGEAWPVAP